MKKVYQLAKGFTLAEVLITLMIIGILAMITIPALMKEWQERATTSQLIKTYSILAQTYINIQRDYGNDFYNVGSPGPIWKQYLAVAKDCNFNGTGCFANYYKNLKENTQTIQSITGSPFYKMLLNDGSAIGFTRNKIYGYVFFNDDNTITPLIYVDTNASKPPNVLGKDVFLFAVTKNTIEPFGGKASPSIRSTYFDKSLCNFTNSQAENGMSCAKWVIERRNMDYKNIDW